MSEPRPDRLKPDRDKSRMPQTSFYEKVIPVLLVGLAVLGVAVVLLALGVALGLVSIQ